MSILLADPARWAPEALQRAAHRPPEAATAAIFIGARQFGTMHSGLSRLPGCVAAQVAKHMARS